MRIKKGDFVLLSFLLVALIGSWLYIRSLGSDQVTAIISSNGQVIREINLASVTEPFQFQVEDGRGGYNIVAVEPGRIRVIEANCPEQVDVNQGWISQPHQSLVCLPNRLAIEIRASGRQEIDGIVR